MALSEKAGVLQLRIPRDTRGSGYATLGEKPLRFDDYFTEDVEISTLDAVVESLSLQSVDFIKIDTEGHELYVLRGAEETLKRFYPLVVAEYHPVNTAQNGYQPELILQYMSGLGYSHRMMGKEDVFFYAG